MSDIYYMIIETLSLRTFCVFLVFFLQLLLINSSVTLFFSTELLIFTFDFVVIGIVIV